VVSHISRKTSEIWGTRDLLASRRMSEVFFRDLLAVRESAEVFF
jgi:hypothetical protein